MSAEKIKITYQELYTMFIDGLTTAEMARRLYTSESTIRRRLQDFNLIRDNVKYDKDMYWRMKELGISEEDIAYVFGSSFRSFCRWKCRSGLAKKYKTKKPETCYKDSGKQ